MGAVPGADQTINHENRTSEVVREFLYQGDGLFPVKVQKLVFYADVYCTEKYGARLSTADFKPFMYGAYSEEIREALNKLKERPEIATKPGMRNGQVELKYYSSTASELSNKLQNIVSEVLERTADWNVDDLTKFSKKNWLFAETDYDEVIEFGVYREALENSETSPIILDPIEISTAKLENEMEDYPEGLILFEEIEEPGI